MGRFKFTDSLSETLSKDAYNTMINDFSSHIGSGGIEPKDFKSESLRYRHLAEPPVIFLYKEIVLSDAHASTLNGSSYDNTYVTIADVIAGTNYIQFTPTYSDDYAISVTAYYYPYCLGSTSQITISTRNLSSVWAPNEDIARYVGATKGIDPARYFHTALSPTTSPPHYYYPSQVNSRTGTACVAQPIVVTGLWGKASSIEGAATAINRYSVAIKRDTTKYPTSGTYYAESSVSAFDRIYIFATARAIT